MYARPVLKNKLVFVSRCVDQQRFRLAPSPERNEIIEYLVAVLTRRHSIGLVALTVMSNHYHGVFFDPLGRLPRFTAELHANLARALNWADRDGHGGRLWDGQQTNQLNLNSNDIVLDKISYVMANPVAAGAVAHGKSWPGVRVCWPSPAKVVRRPHFFRDIDASPVARPKGHRRRKPTREAVRRARESWNEELRFPEFALLETVRPPGFGDSEAALKAKIQKTVREREARARAERAAVGLSRFLGARACKNLDLESTPASMREPSTMTPTFVGEDAEARKAELEKRQAWRAAYRAALERRARGDLNALFPVGTYFMRIRCGVRVDTAPPS